MNAYSVPRLAQAHLRNYSAEGARSRLLTAENVGYKGKMIMSISSRKCF